MQQQQIDAMILIADSGSTRTDWRWIDKGRTIGQVKTKGFNPYYQEIDDMVREIKSQLVPELDLSGVDSIHFYGAGCSTKARQKKINHALSIFFGDTKISVYSDLIGAARALCRDSHGIACILGTGSGSCYYDGERVLENIPSLGFILGDEGGGAWLGKKLVTDYLRGHMPEQCMSAIREQLHIDKEMILEHVNHKPMPSRYLAGFARFISENLDQAYFYHLMFDGFTAFAKNYIIRYPQHTECSCHFVGSVAFHNQEVLHHVARYVGFEIGNIIKSPIDGLITYHSSKA